MMKIVGVAACTAGIAHTYQEGIEVSKKNLQNLISVKCGLDGGKWTMHNLLLRKQERKF